MSLLLHLILLVLLARLVQSPSRSLPGQPDRSGGITLVTTDDERVVYVDEPDRGTGAETAEDTAGAIPGLESPVARSLPVFELPSVGDHLPASDALIARPDLRTGGRPRLPSGGRVGEILAQEQARRRDQVPLGPTTRLSLFGTAAIEGRSFFFAIDRSNSMGSGGLNVLNLARREFATALEALEPVHQFQILAYHHQRVFFADQDLVPATMANKKTVSSFLQGLAAFGGTNHHMAIMSAIHRRPDVLFLLTDGGDPPLTDAQLAVICQANAGRTAIHCIVFGFGSQASDDHFLERLARENNGSYRYLDVSRWRSDRAF